MDLSEARRYTLITCLIDYTQKKIKDNLAQVFCKIMATIHKRARAELIILREKNMDQTREWAYFVRSILGTFKDNTKNPKAFFENVRTTIKTKGSVEELTQVCDQVIAGHSTNHHPLL